MFTSAQYASLSTVDVLYMPRSGLQSHMQAALMLNVGCNKGVCHICVDYCRDLLPLTSKLPTMAKAEDTQDYRTGSEPCITGLGSRFPRAYTSSVSTTTTLSAI